MIVRRRALLVAGLGIAMVVAACGDTGPDATPSIGAGAGVAGPTPVANPGSPDAAASSGDGNGGGGGAAPNPGAGLLDPDEPVLVAPVAHVRDVRDVGATTLEAAVDGRRVTARVTWWSGVEPCTALAGIEVERVGRDITLTIREGSAAGPDVMCTAQVIHKAAIVDLGELAPGSWTIHAPGEAPPVGVTIDS